MNEIISVISLDRPGKSIPYDRKEFYSEQVVEYKKNGMPTLACEVINIFLVTLEGEILLQKRSSTKSHNPNLIDKAVGGHINFGDSPEYTVMVESVQELQTPCIALRTENEFEKTLNLLRPYLDTLAVLCLHDERIVILDKIIQGETIKIANKTHIFFGVYHGRTRTVDKEAKGILTYSYEELENELAAYPNQFTGDLHFYFQTYGSDLKKFIEKIKSV